MKYIPLLTAVILTGVLIWLINLMVTPPKAEIVVSSFEDCVMAGNPVMESYPRQCRHGEQLFVEEIPNIKVFEPVSGQTIGATLKITGEARVFENTVNYRLVDSDSTVLLESFTTANAPDIGLYGPFEAITLYPAPNSETGKVEVFTYSARDGSEIDKVVIPVRFPDNFDDIELDSAEEE
ncbi:MAG: hypothetical protein COT81_05285 [Candidatus Buchananbacteria bacterium CG10_big_fil_rev_8_21_14_0_10_42_9]|uniref:Bacterial spore germination immunoglobulin-like domain-containing protein n=1 Tax=Candidatus Buchananbacteria bacterium CG10_big_fil_rev_8_21_14_0_10_42_9 TaxID=1974526 RepID=A0A2H0VZX9_9BACT|nr:MAG: hypothetical protein COT81_05285 [Candidatus Buchananbacteria bacterium CG10_big_fil_rev_8_21_14_0_10_42_9]